MAKAKKRGGNNNKNLKSWKKGQSGNPLGGKLHNPALRAIKRLTAQQVAEVGSMLLEGDTPQLRRVAKSKTEPALKVMIAQVALRCIRIGDYGALDTLLDRFVGKVPTAMEISGRGGSPLSMYLSMEPGERQQLMRQYGERLKQSKG